MLAVEPVAFRACFESLRRRSPSVPEEHFGVWSRASCGPEGAWEMGSGTVMAGDSTLLALLAKAGSGCALVSAMQGRQRGGRAERTAIARRASWVFAHDGKVEDLPYLLSRTNAQRACPGEPDAELLLAFLLSRLDERGLGDLDRAGTRATDDVITTAAGEIGHRIGSLSFLLCDGTTLYAYRFDRSLHLLERQARGRLPATILLASEPLTHEAWMPLEDRTLVRCTSSWSARSRTTESGRVASRLEVAFLSGRDPRPSSDIELPFTD